MLTIFVSLLGGLFYRMRGAHWGGFLNRPFRQMPFAVLFGILAALTVGGLSVSLLAFSVIFLLTTAALTTGHASYQSLGHSDVVPRDGETEEWYGAWLPKFFKVHTTLHDAVGMSISGMLVTLPLAVFFIVTGLFVTGLLVLLAGCLKAVAYWIGWKLYYLLKDKFVIFDDPLKPSEFLSGFLQWGSVFLIVI